MIWNIMVLLFDTSCEVHLSAFNGWNWTSISLQWMERVLKVCMESTEIYSTIRRIVCLVMFADIVYLLYLLWLFILRWLIIHLLLIILRSLFWSHRRLITKSTPSWTRKFACEFFCLLILHSLPSLHCFGLDNIFYLFDLVFAFSNESQLVYLQN